jgi:hypothetical protein
MTEFTQTLRHYCRNPRCRSKLPSPASDPLKAFCTRGCHSSFYLKRCVVCEKPIEQPIRGGRRLVCKKAKCRSAFQDRNGGRGYQASFSTESIQEVPDFIGAKKPLKPDRPYYIVAGPVISANVYHCASLALDPDRARRVDAANDWRRIKREVAWGWQEPRDASLMVSQWEPCVPSNPVADGLSIPDFLRRVAS